MTKIMKERIESERKEKKKKEYLTIIPRARVGDDIANEARSVELAIIVSYPTTDTLLCKWPITLRAQAPSENSNEQQPRPISSYL